MTRVSDDASFLRRLGLQIENRHASSLQPLESRSFSSIPFPPQVLYRLYDRRTSSICRRQHADKSYRKSFLRSRQIGNLAKFERRTREAQSPALSVSQRSENTLFPQTRKRRPSSSSCTSYEDQTDDIVERFRQEVRRSRYRPLSGIKTL